MKKPKVAKKEAKVKAGEYHLSIALFDETFDFDTDDLVHTLLNFTDKPMSIKTKVLFRFSKGEKVYEKVVLPRLARRYFVSPNFAKVLVKNAIVFLN